MSRNCGSVQSMQFKATTRWGCWPPAWDVADVTDVAVDDNDNLIALRRGAHPIVVLGPSGQVLDSWGDGHFTSPHALSRCPDGSVLCADTELNAILRFNGHGDLVGRLDTVADAGAYDGVDPTLPWTITSPGPPFNRPTAAVQAPNGRIFVTDGYGNCRLHRFGQGGELEQSWGEPGSWPGMFTIPHGIAIGPDGLLYVADRLNNRIQILTQDGQYCGEWPAHLPNSLCFDSAGNAYVAELGATITWSTQPPLRWPPARVTVRDPTGKVVTELLDEDPPGRGMYFAPHGIAVDSSGTVWVAEVPFTYSQGRAPESTSVLRRYERIS